MMGMFNGVDLVLVIIVVLLVMKVLDLRKQVEILLMNLKTSHRELNDLRIRYDKLSHVRSCPNKKCTYHVPK